MEITLNYAFDEDGIIRLQKDLNHALTNLDSQNINSVYTKYVRVADSSDGYTEIVGPVLTMYDSSSILRVQMGYSSVVDKFIFNLYDASGNPSIELDSAGNAVFKGYINTAQDVFIGDQLFIGWNASTSLPMATLPTQGIYFIEPESTRYIAAIYTTNVGTSDLPSYEFEMESSSPMNITSKNKMRIYMYAGYSPATTVPNSTDYMTILSWNNRMFLNCEHESGAGATTQKGTFIGHDNHSVYLGSWEAWYQQLTAIRDEPVSWEDKLNYYYMHNVKLITMPTTSWSVESTVNLRLTSSTQFLGSTIGVRYVCITTNSVFLNSSMPVNMDLSQFNDGTPVTTDDFLVMSVYVSSTAAINAAAYKTYLVVGQSSSICHTYSSTNHNYTTGWNLVYSKFSPVTIEGAPNLGAVTFMRIGWNTNVNSTGQYLIFDYIGIIRKNSTDATKFNPFVREVNSTNYNAHSAQDGNVIGKHNGKPCIIQLSPTTSATYYYDLYLRNHQDFELKIDNYSMRQNCAPTLGAYRDADNYVRLSLSSGVLRLAGAYEGSTFANTINCETFNAFNETKIKLRHNRQIWTGSFQVTSDVETYREVSAYYGPGRSLEFMDLYIGQNADKAGSKIHNIEIKRFQE